MTPKSKFCKTPFEEIEINATGECFTCCPNWNNSYSIGNIYEHSFEEVWNSEKAIKLREQILNNDYSLCDQNGCLYLKQKMFYNIHETNCKPVMTELPKVVKFAYDKECNIACQICRDKIKRLSNEDLEILNSKIDTFFLPLLESAKTLIINAHGDPFGSRHSRLVIKKVAERYPNLKFDFHTNGVLLNKTQLNNLGVTPDKIGKVRISIHAASAITYAKTVPNGLFLFPQIVNNLKYLKKLKEEHFFEEYIHFVVTSDNYKEIPDFIKLAQKVDASPRFWEYRRENCEYCISEKLDICTPEHPTHKKLLKVLKHKLVKENKQFFSPILHDLIESQQ